MPASIGRTFACGARSIRLNVNSVTNTILWFLVRASLFGMVGANMALRFNGSAPPYQRAEFGKTFLLLPEPKYIDAISTRVQPRNPYASSSLGKTKPQGTRQTRLVITSSRCQTKSKISKSQTTKASHTSSVRMSRYPSRVALASSGAMSTDRRQAKRCQC